jgi:hypothetical protein
LEWGVAVVNLEFSKKHDEQFERHFDAEMDDITLILKCHLMLEEMLRDFCSAMVPQPRHLADSRFTFAQVLDLAKALYPTKIKIGSLAEMWTLAEKINRVRNLMAHSLEPDSLKLQAHKLAIVKAVKSRAADSEDYEFAGCLTYVLGSFGALLQVAVTHKNGEDFLKIPAK